MISRFPDMQSVLRAFPVPDIVDAPEIHQRGRKATSGISFGWALTYKTAWE